MVHYICAVDHRYDRPAGLAVKEIFSLGIRQISIVDLVYILIEGDGSLLRWEYRLQDANFIPLGVISRSLDSSL